MIFFPNYFFRNFLRKILLPNFISEISARAIIYGWQFSDQVPLKKNHSSFFSEFNVIFLHKSVIIHTILFLNTVSGLQITRKQNDQDGEVIFIGERNGFWVARKIWQLYFRIHRQLNRHSIVLKRYFSKYFVCVSMKTHILTARQKKWLWGFDTKLCKVVFSKVFFFSVLY